MPTHVLVECPALIASVKVGVLDLLTPFDLRGELELKFVETLKIQTKHIEWCDVLITVRGGERTTLEIVRLAKKYGRIVIYYLDDDLLNVPVESEEERTYYERIVKRNLKKIINRSDALWGVNENIRDRYLPFCSSNRWIENKVPMEIKVKRQPGEEKAVTRVLFAGSKGHQSLVREYLTPVVLKLSNELKGKADFTFIGVDSGIYNIENVSNIEYFDCYQDYRSFVENGEFDIGLAIIKDEPFYHCKYYNKFLEYTAIGCIGIYTDSEPYSFVIKNNYNGYLCKNTPEDWEQTIRRVIFDIEGRGECLNNAYEYVEKVHNFENVQNELKEKIPELFSYKALKHIKTFDRIKFSTNYYYFTEHVRMLFKQYGVVKASSLIVVKVCRKIKKCMKKKGKG